jgi:hypothetical protein
LLCTNALMSGRALPTFLDLLGPRVDDRATPLLTIMLGVTLIVTTLIGAETALGFVFDPRYKDFPFAALTMAVVPFATLVLNRPSKGVRPIAEAVFAGLFALAALYTGFNEGANNWQSLWTCAAYLLFALTLWRARAVQILE